MKLKEATRAGSFLDHSNNNSMKVDYDDYLGFFVLRLLNIFCKVPIFQSQAISVIIFL